MSENEARVVQPTTPRTVSNFFAGVITGGVAINEQRDELSHFLSGCTLDSDCVSECPAKKCVACLHELVSPTSRFVNMSFVMKTDIQIKRCAILSKSNVFIPQQQTHTSSVSLGQNCTAKIVYRLHQPKRKKGTIHILIYCRMYISSRKYSRIHYSWCPTAFISLLISIMKMLYHLSDKNHLFQELKP